MHFCRYSSPLGNILLAEEEDAIVYCQWEDTIDEQMITMWEEDKELNSVLLTEAYCQLTEYFTQPPYTIKRHSLSATRMGRFTANPIRRNAFLRRISKADRSREGCSRCG